MIEWIKSLFRPIEVSGVWPSMTEEEMHEEYMEHIRDDWEEVGDDVAD